MVMNFDEHGQVSQRPDLLAGILGSAMDAIIAIDDAHRIVLFNSAAEKIFVCPANEAIGNSIERFIPRRFYGEHREHVRRFAESGVTNRTLDGLGTLWALRATGEEFPIEAAISKVESGGKKFFAVFVRDITERQRAEDAVRESEQRFRLVADSAPVLIWMSGTDKLYTYFNKPWLDFTGRSMEEELGNGWAEGVHPDDLRRCLETYAQCFERRENFRMEYRLRRHDGEYRWVLDVGVPRFNRDRVFAGYIGIGIDVTERKCAERELAQSNERLHLTLEVGRIGGWEWNLKTGQTFWFGQNYALLGAQPEIDTASGETFWNRVHPADRHWLRDSLQKTIEYGKSFTAEFRVVWPDGTVHWLRSEAQFFCGADGRPERMLGMSVDITERKLAEQALRQSEERFRLAAQAGKMFAYEWDVATDAIVRSPEAARILGMDEGAQITGQQIMAQVHPDDRERLTAAVADLSPERPCLEISYRMVRPDGTVIWVERNSRAHFDEQGRMLRVVGMVADVTDRKLAEEARLRHAAIVESSEDAIASVTLDGVIVSWNEGSQRMFGYTENEAVGKPVTILVPPELPDEENKILETVKAGGRIKQFETIRITKTGRRINVSLSISPIKDSTGKIVGCAGIARDITERKQAEDKLREYERTVELSDEAMAVVDRNYRFLIANRKYLGLRKMTKEQVVGHLVPEVLNKGVFEDVVKEKLDECFQGKVVRYELKYTYPELGEREVLVSYFPIEGANGVDRVASIMQDITDRKQLERVLTDMSRKLIEAQEQERARIGRELHDDISQRLAMLSVALERMQDFPREAQGRAQELRKELSQISEDVQALSHELHDSKLEYLGVVTAMRSWCREFAERQRIDVDFKTSVQGVLPGEVGRTLLRVLQEALHNAAKHSGVKHIEVQLSECSGQVHLIIADKGAGFDVESAMKGRGLGLTSMRERVRLVNGTMTIDSKPMNGTKIHFCLPFVPEQKSQRAIG